MGEHRAVEIGQDEHAASFGECVCGFRTDPMPDDEAVIDALMDHAATRARAEFVRFGTWLDPAYYGPDYAPFTQTVAEHIPGRAVPLYRRAEERPA